MSDPGLKDSATRDGAPHAEVSSAQAAAAEVASPRRGWPRPARLAAVACAVVLAYVLGLWTGSPSNSTPSQGQPTQSQAHSHDNDSGQVWTCAMHPQIRGHEPGPCPICGMDLIPVAQQANTPTVDPNRVTLSETAQMLAQIRTVAVAQRQEPAAALRLLGRVDYDETRVRTVTAWTAGRIDRLRVAATGQRIRAGQIIADLYSPEIYSAQQDLRQARSQHDTMHGSNEVTRAAAGATLKAARQRLRLLGVPQAIIAAAETTPKPQVPIRTPFAGTVIERLVNQGNYVDAGQGIYRVADLSRLWVQLDAYETDLPRLASGQSVTLTVAALPSTAVTGAMTGRIAFIDPVIDPSTRTARVRVEVNNPDRYLKPGMFAEAVIQGPRAEAHSPLVIPETAPLFTGRRSLVYVEITTAQQPTYEAREVVLGPKSGRAYPVVDGLAAGERVVVHGAFALDADLQIRGGHSMMTRHDDQTRVQATAEAAIAAQFRQALAPAMHSYFAIQKTLAADDLPAARSAAQRLHAQLAAVTAPAPAAMKSWPAVQPRLADYTAQVAAAEQLAPARHAFEGVSAQVIAILAGAGNPLDISVHLVLCPMAIDNRTARWVQIDESIANSYLGNGDMLTCGAIESTVTAGQRLPAAVAAEIGVGQP